MTRTTKKKKEKEKSAYLLQSKNTSKSAPLNQGMALFWSLLESFSQEGSFVLMQPCGSVLDAGIKSVNGNS